jgi:hypothetical protein
VCGFLGFTTKLFSFLVDQRDIKHAIEIKNRNRSATPSGFFGLNLRRGRLQKKAHWGA